MCGVYVEIYRNNETHFKEIKDEKEGSIDLMLAVNRHLNPINFTQSLRATRRLVEFRMRHVLQRNGSKRVDTNTAQGAFKPI